MKAAAIAPILAAGRQAWADPTTENTLLFMRVAPMPSSEILWVQTASQTHAPGVDKNRVEIVWRVLWAHYHLGLGCVEFEEGVKPAETAYNTKLADGSTLTGAKLAESIKKDRFDPLGNEYQTNVCAYICAHKAAVLALARPSSEPKKVSPAIFQAARDATQKEMTEKLDCARSLSKTVVAGPGLGFAC